MQLDPNKQIPYNYQVWVRTNTYEILPKDITELIKDKYLYPIVDIVDTSSVNKNGYVIKEPQIHSMVKLLISSCSCEIHENYLVTDLRKSQKSEVISIYIHPIIKYYPSKNKAKIDMTAYSNELKPKFSKGYARWEQKGCDINAQIFDKYIEFRE